MARFYEKLTKPTALADGDIFVISVGSGTSWIDYKITYSQLKDVIKTISDMQNYYTKSQTYTQAEVNAAISSAIGAVYKPSGSKTCAELVSSLLIAANKGNVYNITDSGVTTEYFVDGAGKTINAGDNVSIVEVSTDVFKFDLLSGFIDLTGYQTKNLASAIEGQTTVEGALAALSANKANLSEVYTKTQINDDFVKKSATAGLLKNDGSVDTNTYVPAVTGKGLSTEDYTTPEKSKLAGISDGATKTESSLTNGHLEIDDVDVTVYDDTALDSRVDVVEQDLSISTRTVEGNPLNFSTLTAQKANETVISLAPIQDLHGYDYPWPAGGGKSKIDLSTAVRTRCTVSESGDTYTFTISGSYYPRAFVDLSSLKNAGDFYVSFEMGGTSARKLVRIEESQNGTAVQTLARNYTTSVSHVKLVDVSSYTEPVLAIYVDNTDGGVIGNTLTLTKFMISSGATDEYEPYSNICPIDGRTETSLLGTNGKESTDPDYVESNNLTIQFGEKVYGAKVELESGTVTVDTAIVDMGTLEWDYYDSYTYPYFQASLSIPTRTYPLIKIMCSSYAYAGIVSVGTFRTNDYDKKIACRSGNSYVMIQESSYTDKTTFKTAVTGQQICYELATPRTITLTPNEISLLEGVNNISTDGDSISLTYRDGKVATLGDLDGLVKKIADCEDVEITDLQASDVLVWDATAGKWKNQANTNTHVYSTTEQVVGTWVDGSTIYEKTITGLSFTTVLDGWADSGASLSDVDKVIRCECGQNFSSMIEICFARVDNGKLYIWTTNRVTYEFNNIVIQYTKTTPTLLMQSTEESTPADESTDENR